MTDKNGYGEFNDFVKSLNNEILINIYVIIIFCGIIGFIQHNLWILLNYGGFVLYNLYAYTSITNTIKKDQEQNTSTVTLLMELTRLHSIYQTICVIWFAACGSLLTYVSYVHYFINK